ncbi:MAG: phosphate ABC transporter ATP-binding protein PstB [Oscillospiraceae bacterium]|jgi:phosphate transport system ATP-binding protein|nr:phosphate ABC transporter ATP-binding protein PstB [Oscillospiraceae bacterium]
MPKPPGKSKLTTRAINLYYGNYHALGDITVEIPECAVTAVIGPSGCGKSSFLRLFNRMNDLIPTARVEGEAFIDGAPVYGKDSDAVSLRKRVGMVFQKPNVFPMSIYENIVIGPRHHGVKNRGELDAVVERCLAQVALWDELKDVGIRNKSGLELSSGQRQRLCIARALAVDPEVILMDESCSALDPESTMKIEELMADLACRYTIIIVTHNMEQALRVSDMSAFFMIDGDKVGRLVEYAPTIDMFYAPKDKRTEDYITGRFG